MDKKVCFIGHRWVDSPNEIRKKLYYQVEAEIKNGCKTFTMGTHGEFDSMALSVCRELRRVYSDITIQVAITSFNTIKPVVDYDSLFGAEKYIPYDDVETIMYGIEELHYKQKIVASNRQMIDNSDILICYVDTAQNRGGAILAYKYAKKQGLNIINLYTEN